MPSNHPTHPNDPVPWPPAHCPVNLTDVIGAFGPLRGADHRPTPGKFRRIVQLVEDRLQCVEQVAPPPLIGFLDGVQRTGLLGRVEELRDLRLAWVAAGTVLGKTFVDHQVRLAAVCSVLDVAEVASRAPNLPVTALRESTPWGLALAADEWVDDTRRRMERLAIDAAPSADGHVLVVDGSLPGDCARNDLTGVVKSLETDWLADQALVPQVEGWRSPALRIPGRFGERDKVTAYVRLHTATRHHWWGHGLVRIEILEGSDVDLDAAAALAFVERGRPGYGDPRWPVQLKPMWNTERTLKLAIPHALSLIG